MFRGTLVTWHSGFSWRERNLSRRHIDQGRRAVPVQLSSHLECMLQSLARQQAASNIRRQIVASWRQGLPGQSWLHTGSPRSPQTAPQQTQPVSKEDDGEQEILDLLGQSRLSSPEKKDPLNGQQVHRSCLYNSGAGYGTVHCLHMLLQLTRLCLQTSKGLAESGGPRGPEPTRYGRRWSGLLCT